MAVFDVIVNNADHKGAHILAMPDGHRYGVDHGLTFHVADKLRTVLWGWLGEALSEEERDGVSRVLEGLDGELGRELAELLIAEEIGALAERCAGLLNDGIFPAPSGLTPAAPWPLFCDTPSSHLAPTAGLTCTEKAHGEPRNEHDAIDDQLVKRSDREIG